MTDWSSLDAELECWAQAHMTLPLWWRDDDAVAPTPALARLSDLAGELGLPVHIAVIPARATQALADTVGANPHLIPLVHGWAHENHAPAGQKKAEFGKDRPTDMLAAHAARARGRLMITFGDRLAQVFVPPWNRISEDLIPILPEIGFKALSTFTPRSTRYAAPGLEQINTHLDPIDWKGTRGLVDPDRLITQCADDLRARREGRSDNTEPYGILTHHLVHDAAIWDFTGALLARLLDGPAKVWNAQQHFAKDITT